MKQAVLTLLLVGAVVGTTVAATVESFTAVADPNLNPDGLSSLGDTADVWQVAFTSDGCSGSYYATNGPGGNVHAWALYSCLLDGTNGGAEAFHAFDGTALAIGQVASINYAHNGSVAWDQTVGIRLYSGVGKEVEFSLRGGSSQFQYTDSGTTNGYPGFFYSPNHFLKVSFAITGSNTYIGTVTETSPSGLLGYWTGTFANPITQVSVFNDRAGNSSDQYFDNLVVTPYSNCASTTGCINVLFVGNSFTYAAVDPVFHYNNANVHDFNGTRMGGVPGVFQKLATDSGRSNLAVNIEAVGGQTLAFHLANKSAVITNPGFYGPWDWVILQDYSTRPTAVGAVGGDVAGFRSNVQTLNNLATNNNPGVRTLLYCTWGRPDLVAGGYFTSIQAMQGQLTTNYNNAAHDFNLFGYAPVGDAFMAAVASGLSINPNVTSTPGPGQINLWFVDNYHASVYGSYLSALVFYAKIFGADPRSLPTGPGSAAWDLGLNSTIVTQLQSIAYEMVFVDNFSFAVDPNAQTVSVGSNAAFTVTVVATNGFTGDVALSVTGLPSNANADFSPPSIADSGTSTLTVTTFTNTPPGEYPLTVTGTSSNLTHTSMITLTVIAPDYSFVVNPNSQTVTASSNVTFTVTVGATNGFTGDVTLSVTGLPAGVSADFNPPSVTGSGTSILTVPTYTNTPPGSYPFTITGTSSNLSHTSLVTLTINLPPGVIPDWWKQQYFGCVDCSRADVEADPDGDSQNNLTEFLAGTDPTNNASAFRIIGFAQEGDDMRIVWTTTGGRTNTVQAVGGNSAGGYIPTTNFIDIAGPVIVTGSGDITTNYVDVGGATNGPGRFYRVRLAP